MSGHPLVPQPEPTRTPLPLVMGGDEPIVGHRLWIIRYEVIELTEDESGVRYETPVRPRLASIAKPMIWRPREEVHAECWAIDKDFAALMKMETAVDHRAPFPDGGCGCGVWAFPDMTFPVATMWASADALLGTGNAVVAWALGGVKLWGRVVECERGYRAEYAYPTNLQLVDGLQLAAHAQGALSMHADIGLSRIAEQLAHDYGVPAVALDAPPPLPEEVELQGSGFLIVLPTLQGDAMLRRRAATHRNFAWLFAILTVWQMSMFFINDARGIAWFYLALAMVASFVGLVNDKARRRIEALL